MRQAVGRLGLAILGLCVLLVIGAHVFGLILPYDGEILYMLRDTSNVSYTPYSVDVLHGLAFQWRKPFRANNVLWSPDYQTIVITELTTLGAVTKLLHRREGSAQVLSYSGAIPLWSPDHRQLVFESQTGTTANLYIANGDGTQIQPLTPRDGAAYTQPTWSPDGTQLAFVRDGDLYTISLADQTLHPLLVTPDETEFQPIWSPNGLWLAYWRLSSDNELHLIHMVEPHRQQALAVDDPNTFDSVFGFVWSPVGEQLVYLEAGSERIHVIRANTHGTQTVLSTTYPLFGTVGMSWVDERLLRIYWMEQGNTGTPLFYEDDIDTLTDELVVRYQQDTLLPTRSPDGSMTARYTARDGLCIRAQLSNETLRCIQVQHGTPTNLVWLP
jgi:WD40 repeat protein